MSIAAAIRDMLARGLTIDQALDAAEAFELHAAPTRTARQDRNARYYQARKGRIEAASETVLNKTLKTVSDEAGSFP